MEGDGKQITWKEENWIEEWAWREVDLERASGEIYIGMERAWREIDIEMEKE